MISRHIPVEPENDNYGRLARYLARTGEYAEEKEPPFLTWCGGCIGGEDYAEGIAEVQDVQALNTRSKAAKTYHLVVSFRPEDEAKLTPDILREIEQRFTTALGLSEHQRHCAVHTDTQNIHMQIAYNLIHPVTLTRNDHPWDYNKRDALCRELEREYGLTVDNGMEKERQPRNEKAVAVEAQGLQSFDGYVQERKASILAALDTAIAAQSWQLLHKELHRHGLEIHPRGNGLIIKNRHGKQAVKASDVDRRLSKSKLESVLGVYMPPFPTLEKEESRYRNRPMQRSPEGEALYAQYQAEATDRKQQAESEKALQNAAIAAIREKWRLKRAEIEKSTMLKQNRRNLIAYARKMEAHQISDAVASVASRGVTSERAVWLCQSRISANEERKNVAVELAEARALSQQQQTAPRYESWNDFLRRHADQGDETALAVLRSRKQPMEVEGPPPAPRPPALAAIKAEYAEKQLEVLRDTDQTRKGKKILLAYLRMEALLKEGHGLNLRPEDVARSVDNKGAVVFTLPGGGKVRDTGKEIWFSSADELAAKVAEGYARKKWGQRVRMNKGSLVFDTEAGKERERESPEPERYRKGLSR